MSGAIWTIGYEKCGQAALIATLKNARITSLVDVRELPNSRRAGFAKRQLSAALEEAGIAYRHMKPLGTPKAGREANKRGDMETFHAIYAQTLAQPEAQLALEDLAAQSKTERQCLLCLEHDWRRCHRAQIAEALAERGVSATHLEPAETA